MAERDFRTMNMEDGQLAEHDLVFKRIGDLAYRNHGVMSKSILFDAGKALISGGLESFLIRVLRLLLKKEKAFKEMMTMKTLFFS